MTPSYPGLSASSTADELPRRHRPDYFLVIIMSILLASGLIVIYSISPGLAISANVSQNYYVVKQLIAIGIGIIAFLIAANIPLAWWRRLQVPLAIAAVLSVIAVRLFGQQVLGAYRWIQIGGVSFQAAELIKIALIVWLAAFLSDHIRDKTISNARKTLIPLAIVLGLIAVAVAGVESDLGSTGVMVAIMAAMIFVAGLPLKRILVIGGIIIAVAVLAVSFVPYRRARLITFLHPTSDCLNTGYQACQALIAVGSGGTMGLGLGRSVQAYGYLPEAANDSIFAIFGEKFGFIGSVILLGLFLVFFMRLMHAIDYAPNNFTRLLVVGILAWLSTQTLINIGAMIGLLPLKGITLPFISYGGTSVVFVMAASGLVFQISHYTLLTKSSTVTKGGPSYDNHLERRRVGRAYHTAPSGR